MVILGGECDRCGKKYSLFEDSDNQISYRMQMVIRTEWIPEERKGCDVQDIHLCIDCQNEIADWLTKGVNNGKA